MPNRDGQTASIGACFSYVRARQKVDSRYDFVENVRGSLPVGAIAVVSRSRMAAGMLWKSRRHFGLRALVLVLRLLTTWRVPMMGCRVSMRGPAYLMTAWTRWRSCGL